MYRVAWKFKDDTGNGHGDYCFNNKESAQELADYMNLRFPSMEHWAEEEEWPDVIGEAEENGAAA